MRANDTMKVVAFTLMLTIAGLVISSPDVHAMPKPEPGKLGKTHWTAKQGEEFPYTSWLPDDGQPEAVFVAVHGLSGAADDFRPLGKYFAGRSIAVYAHELRGQGNDPVEKRRGDIKSAKLWYSDLDCFLEFVRRRHKGVPIYLFGESLGSLIVIHSLATLSRENQAAVTGLVFTSPVVGFKQSLPFFVRFFVHFVGVIVPTWRVSLDTLAGGSALDAVQVTSDTTHAGQMSKTKHHLSHFTLRLLKTVDRMVRTSRRAARSVEKPVFVIYSGNDFFTSPDAVKDFFRILPSKSKEMYFSEDSYHLILHDKDAKNALAALNNWMQTCCGDSK